MYAESALSKSEAIKESQNRVQESLETNSDFNISFKETQNILEKHIGSKVNLVILNIDLVGSTKMSFDLALDKLTTIIRSFTQEMSIIVSEFGGYVLKYVGDAVLAFFVFENAAHKNQGYSALKVNNNAISSPYDSVIECAKNMIEVIQKGMNPILTRYGYPELKVRIGIDYGKIAVVKYGVDIDELDEKKIAKRIHLDMIGYTISIAVKMTSVANTDHIVIGQSLYEKISKKQKEIFREQPAEQDIWKYIERSAGKSYLLYQNIK
jgi:adenylate cyclase